MSAHFFLSNPHCGVYLCNKLDDLDEDVEGHVSGHYAARSFWEKCRNNGAEPSGDTETAKLVGGQHLPCIFLSSKM